MKNEEKQRAFEILKPIIAGLGRALGANCEIVLHDFSRLDDSIIAIENNTVTGRQVGDGLDELSFQVLQHNPNPPDLFNYKGRRNVKILRSSSILLRDESNKPFGAVGINIDITALLSAQQLLSTLTTIEEPAVEETFERSVREVLERYIEEAVKHVGKDPAMMDKEDKIVAAVVLANAYPFAPHVPGSSTHEPGYTELLTALHLPIALWLAVGIAYAGGRWGEVAGRMDFIRFSGELFIYYVLIALGGGVLTAFIAQIFRSIGVIADPFFQSWLIPCGAMGAVVVASWLVEAKQSVIENMAPVLTRLFTPLFAAALLVFLAALLWTGRGIDIERNVLIAFDLLLVVVLGLLL